MDILTEIFAHKQVEVAAQKRSMPLTEFRRQAETSPVPTDFLAALRDCHLSPALIAEVKFHSPSKGKLVEGVDPVRLASRYARSGAAGISVLTDEKYFHGHLDHLRLIHTALPEVPLLRKDFIFDAYQIYEARAAGASSILLIAAYLEPGLLEDLHELALDLHMTPLVEIHEQKELNSILRLPNLKLIGVNNRNLRTFQVNLGTCLRLRPLAPPEVCFVAESGIHSFRDVQLLRNARVNAILVGEALVTAPDPGKRIQELLGLNESNLGVI